MEAATARKEKLRRTKVSESKQTNKQTDKQTNGQTNGQTNKQTNKRLTKNSSRKTAPSPILPIFIFRLFVIFCSYLFFSEWLLCLEGLVGGSSASCSIWNGCFFCLSITVSSRAALSLSPSSLLGGFLVVSFSLPSPSFSLSVLLPFFCLDSYSLFSYRSR